jgi:hypothetical protein
MQHYGVPTRLLDWTENPLVALFFALERVKSELLANDDAVVWILDPVELNLRALSNREGTGKVLGAYSPELEGYMPSPEGRRVSMILPLAVYGIHNSPRIVNQRGGFMLFGKSTTPLEENADVLRGGIIKYIRIKSSGLKGIFADLFKMGVSDSVIYPDLDGLGRELRNRRGF